ncbi:hypothetical protein MMC28_002830 [Mycoblastus sanguinarius]|nr:hypothetical protein [Mycoblastus sanguinarius]
MWKSLGLAVAVWLACQTPSTAQSIPPQNNQSITPAEAAQAGIDPTTAANAAAALDYERSQYAFGSVDSDDFYTVSNSSNATAGTLLKVEAFTNTSAYFLPPNTALSRIVFQSKNLNGSLVPVSAFVLWPYAPRAQPDGTYQVIAWAHGTSGIYGNCAPSHIKDLVYQFAAPYDLALEGYVVVAPDYAGLGVDKHSSGRSITHQLLASPALANDLFYSVQAAQSAFSVLSKDFVVMGHSEGGGAAWAAAQRQAVQPVPGYLGAVAASPYTSLLQTVALAGGSTSLDANYLASVIATSVANIFPTFNLSDFLTPAGEARLSLLAELQGCNAVSEDLLLSDGLAQEGWSDSFYAQAWENLTHTGGKNISGPILILQGTADPVVPAPATTTAVNATCSLFPQTQLEYVQFEGVTHVPVLFATHRVWMGWIGDRFSNLTVKAGCNIKSKASLRPYADYQAEQNWFLQLADEPYE